MARRQTPNTRARDSDRTGTCAVLDSALADGQLSMEDHRRRVSAATNAATLGELQSLVADLQAANPVQPFVMPTYQLRGYRAVMAVVVGVLVVCAVVVGWLVLRSDDRPPDVVTSTPSAEAPEPHGLAAEPSAEAEEPAQVTEDPPAVVLAPPRELHSAEGMARVIDEIRKRFGDTMGYELAITPDDAILARPDPSDDGSKLLYEFEGGWGDPSTRPRSDTDDVADPSGFDVPAAAAALQAAPETLRIAPGDVSNTFIDVDHVAEPGPGALELLVKVTTTSGTDGWIYLDGAGNIKRVEYPS